VRLLKCILYESIDVKAKALPKVKEIGKSKTSKAKVVVADEQQDDDDIAKQIDDDDDDKLFSGDNKVESWCHSFAYYFLLGDERGLINELKIGDNIKRFNYFDWQKNLKNLNTN
jgi:hypothetical protein